VVLLFKHCKNGNSTQYVTLSLGQINRVDWSRYTSVKSTMIDIVVMSYWRHRRW